MGSGQPITLDGLPLKRILALEESGTELFPPETTAEDKALALLRRIDFGQFSTEKDVKKSKSDKEVTPQSPPAWPWQGLVEHLQEAHQELSVMLDLIKHVEENQAVTVNRIERPKPLVKEVCSEAALRLSSKVSHFQDVAKYLKKTAKALEHQVEREGVFYGALMRVQRNWKLKRQRGISAVPGGSAGFFIDLSDPPSADGSTVLSQRGSALCTAMIDQNSAGMLVALPPPGQPMNSLHLRLRTAVSESFPRETCGSAKGVGSVTEDGHDSDQEFDLKRDYERGVTEGVDKGAKGAQTVLRRIQEAVFDEQIFECLSREALLPSPITNVVGISDTSLQLSLGHAATLVLELVDKDRKRTMQDGPDPDKDKLLGSSGPRKETGFEDGSGQRQSSKLGLAEFCERSDSAGAAVSEIGFEIFLKQAYHHSVFAKRMADGAVDVMPTKLVDGPAARVREPSATSTTGGPKDSVSEMSPTILRKLSAAMRHRVSYLKVASVLERQFLFHPTWHPRVSAWDLSLQIPETNLQWQLDEWSDFPQARRVLFECTVVLRDESLTVEGLEEMSPLEDFGKGLSGDSMLSTKHSCSLMELPSFLLFQVATQLVVWVHEEALSMGLRARRDLLSVNFPVENYGVDVAIVACPDVKEDCVNWLLNTSGNLPEDSEHRDGVFGQNQRFLGPLPAESLMSLISHLLNLSEDHSME